MEHDTAVLECAVTNIDTAVTVSLDSICNDFTFIVCHEYHGAGLLAALV